MLIKKKFTRHLILSSIHLITEILSVTIIEAIRIFLTSLITLQQKLTKYKPMFIYSIKEDKIIWSCLTETNNLEGIKKTPKK